MRSHPAVPLATRVGLGKPVVSRRLLVLAVFCSMLPDLEVIGFWLGVPYGSVFGHRGFILSLTFATARVPGRCVLECYQVTEDEMADLLKSLEADVLKLEEKDRAKLARILLLSLEPSEDQDVELVWAEEAERRYQELQSGASRAIPSAEVMLEARSRLK